MARRTLPMIEIKEILYQWCQGRSPRAIAKSLDTARNTIKKYISEAIQLGLSRDNKEKLDEVAAKMEATRNLPTVKYGHAHAILAAHHHQLEEWHSIPDMTVVQMQRLFKEQGVIVGETSIRRYLKSFFPKELDITVVLKTVPGRQAQVDFGYVGMMFDPILQKERRTYAFVMTLSHSRYRFVRFVFRQDIGTWIDCHVRAFEFLGGVPETILLDNLKAGVIKPDIYDPTINRTYAELERHYGFVADPAKVRTPEHKGKVERSIPIVRQQLIAGRNYKEIQEANERAIRWCKEEISQVVTRTTGETPLVRFNRDEKPILKALPPKAFESSVWVELLVHKDCHIVFKGSFYSVPYMYVGQDVWVRAGTRLLQIFANERLVKSHILASSKGMWITDLSDYPEHKQGFLRRDKAYCLEQAKLIGVSVYTLLDQLINSPSITLQRKAQAILRLSDRHGKADLDAACKHALMFGNLEYQSIKSILENVLLMNQLVTERSQPSRLSKGAFLREANEFSVEEMQVCI